MTNFIRPDSGASKTPDAPKTSSVPYRKPVGPPTNDSFANATPIAGLELISGSTIGATVEGGEYPPAEALPYYYSVITGPYNSVWYAYTAGQTGVVFIRVTGSGNDYTYFDVYTGGMVTNHVNVNYANYVQGANTSNVPLSVTSGETYYIRVSNATGADFKVQVATQSTTPPGNDNQADATDVGTVGGSNTYSGTTDGSTVQTGEPDPQNGGQLSNLAGTVWYKYVAPADGMIAAWTSRSDAPVGDWYRIGVWEGASPSAGIIVPPYQDKPPSYSTATSWAAYYEVKSGQTYWIQVIRDVQTSFGSFTLHIDEYLETKEFSFPTDSFTSTTGDIVIDGDTITCTGNQAITDVIDVTPQYGTIDLGADTPKFYREFRISFEVRILGGQVLYRPMWYGDDDTYNTPLASDDHVNYTMATLGLIRCRDITGATIMAVYLHDDPREGCNAITFRTAMTNPSGYAPLASASVSLGTGRPQHDTGWVSVEILLEGFNSQGFDAAATTSHRLYAWVDGKPATDSFGISGYSVGAVRYIDFGMFRHPSLIVSQDQHYVEDNEAWTFEMRNMHATNKVKLQPYDVAFVGDRGIQAFDGFSAGVEVSGMAKYPSSGGNPIETMPTKSWKSIHSTNTNRVQLTYDNQRGAGRVYAFSLYLDAMPSSKTIVARYGTANAYYVGSSYYYSEQEQTHGLAALSVSTAGELRIRPFGWLDFCAAHLETGKHYFIEVHTDWRFKHDTKCTVYINDHLMGTYSNKKTWAQVAARVPGTDPQVRWFSGYIWASWSFYENLTFGVGQNAGQGNADANPTSHDLHYTNTIAARDPGDKLGPKQVVKMGAATVDGLGHWIPSNSLYTEEMELFDGAGNNYSTLYGWMTKVEDPTAHMYTRGSGGEDRYYPYPYIPRFWEAYFRLRGSWPMQQSGSDFTMCGESVPVSATITGITVEAPTGGTAQLIKGGSPVGSSLGDTAGLYGSETEMWGTSWTPQEVNALDFGVNLTGVSISYLSQIKIQVYFDDYGAPLNIGRGGGLPNTGLFNVWGDCIVSEFFVVGAAGGEGIECGGFWEGGGEPQSGPGGGPPVTTGTPVQRWGSIAGMWLWQARGMKTPSVGLNGTAGETVTVSDYRAVRNPLVKPRFATSSDNGATWTWIDDPYETGSAAYILDDAGATNTGNTLFLDNAGSMDVFHHQGGGWSAGFFEDRPSSSPAYRYVYHQFRYGNSGTSETVVDSVNIYARCRSYNGHPNTSAGSNTSMWVMVESPDGNTKRGGIFGAGGSSASPYVSRAIVPRAPGCVPWTPSIVSDLMVRVGSSPTVYGGGFGNWNNQVGAALLGLHYELLVPATPDEPAGGCGGVVTMHWRVRDEVITETTKITRR